MGDEREEVTLLSSHGRSKIKAEHAWGWKAMFGSACTADGAAALIYIDRELLHNSFKGRCLEMFFLAISFHHMLKLKKKKNLLS